MSPKIPDQFQEEAIAKAVASIGLIVRGATGTGKTLVAIEVGKRSRTPGGGWRGLVVCPKKARHQWAQMIREQDEQYLEAIIPDHVAYNYSEYSGWCVIGWHELLDHSVMEQLCAVTWDLVVADEAHRIKNRKTKMSAAIKRLPRIKSLCLTATPMEKTPADLWSLLDFTRTLGDFTSFWGFTHRWVIIEKDWMEHWHYGGPKDPVEFAQMMTKHMYTWNLDVPYENEMEEVLVDMEKTQQKLYDQLKEQKDILVRLSTDDQQREMIVPNALSLITRAQQLSTHPPLLGFGVGSGKMEWLKEFVDDHPDEGILIFTRFRDAAFYVAAFFDADIIVGGVSKEFAPGGGFTSGAKRICVGTIDAMGEAIDGLQRAKYAIFLDAHWSTIKMTQALGRIFRKGITGNKETFLLHSCKEDKLVLDAIDRKWTEADLVYHYLSGLQGFANQAE